MSPYILLYSIIGNILYIYSPSNVSYSVVCFTNDTLNTWESNCRYMQKGKINDKTPIYLYHLSNTEIKSNFFKILYHYSNRTIFDTNWKTVFQKNCLNVINNTKADLLGETKNSTNFPIYFNFTLKSENNNMLNYLSFTLSLLTFGIILVGGTILFSKINN
jgi:hypothetical protein